MNHPLLRTVALTGLLLILGGMPASSILAQSDPPAEAQAPTSTAAVAPLEPLLTPAINPQTGALPTLEQLFFYSPYINGVLVGLSAIALTMFLWFLLSINGRAMAPADLVEQATKLVVAGKYEAAADLCRNHRRVFIASIIQRCAENADKDPAVLMDMIDAEGRRRADILWNRISYLADISNVAPMIGLLGTVTGMIKSFFGLSGGGGTVNAVVLSAGIGEAMSTTMFGLSVSIMALLFYSLTKGRATKALAEAEGAVHAIADHIKRVDRPAVTEH